MSSATTLNLQIIALNRIEVFHFDTFRLMNARFRLDAGGVRRNLSKVTVSNSSSVIAYRRAQPG
jgi:hypothetical protein